VDLTEAWLNEPRDFTPWLAANLNYLSEAIGVQLSDPQTEVKTDQSGLDRFCADIVATAPGGEKVLIENQFTQSDHGHLGQILTYLGGVMAKIVIWVAPQFRESHKSAIRWLNSNTHEDYAFFAVELRVVRIGDSQLAPLFEVIERPNRWERRLVEKQREISSPHLAERREFWEAYVKRHPQAASDPGGGGQGSTRWREIRGSELVVARWFLNDNAGLFVRGGRGIGYDVYYDLPDETKRRLEQRLGLGMEEDGGYPLIRYWPGKIEGKSHWEPVIDWLEDETQRYAAVLQQEFGGAA
jgi:hypothetical protein